MPYNTSIVANSDLVSSCHGTFNTKTSYVTTQTQIIIYSSDRQNSSITKSNAPDSMSTIKGKLNASITTASGSGFHDANFDIGQFNLDANRSIVGLPHNFASCKNTFESSIHSTLSLKTLNCVYRRLSTTNQNDL
jgi:hypothetical protein